MEQKYESDLTKKEKRQLEWQKIKGMGVKDKLEYFWMYYKHVLVLLFSIVMLCSLFWTMHKNRNINYILNLVVVDAYYETTEPVEALREELLTLLGTGDKNEMVSMDLSASSSEEDYNAAMKMMVLLAAADVDIFICRDDVYKGIHLDDAFIPWEEVLGEDYEKYESYITDGYLDFSKSEKWKEYGLTIYDPACAGVLHSAKNMENIKKVVEYFFEAE